MANKWERRKTTSQESEPKTYAHTPSQDLGLADTNSICVHSYSRKLTDEETAQELQRIMKAAILPETFNPCAEDFSEPVKAPPSPRRTFSAIAAQAKQEAKQPKEYTEPMEFEGPVDFIKKLIVHRKHVTSELKSRVKTLATSLELQALQAIEEAVKQRKIKLK